MTDFFDSVEMVTNHLVKSVYATVPSHSNKQIGKWKKHHEGLDISKATGLGSRVFDITEPDDSLIRLFTGSGVDTWEVKLNIEVSYPSQGSFKKIAFGDATKIEGQFFGSSNIGLVNSYASCFRFEDPTIEEEEDENYMIMTLPFTFEVYVGLETTIESWIDTETGIAVQDT